MLLFLLAGCSATEVASAPVATSSPSSSPSPTAATPSEEPSTAPAFTDQELVDLCIGKTIGDHQGAPEFLRDQATIERIESEAPWFVLVPVIEPGDGSLSYCTIGGTPDAPTFVLHGAAIASMEPEIRDWAGAGPELER